MPTLTIRLNACDAKLDALFQGIELNAEIKYQLTSLKKYYYNLHIADVKKEESIQRYELFVQSLEGIKKGQLQPEDVLKEFDELNSLRKKGIVLENILKALELLFWATSACTLFAASVLFVAAAIIDVSIITCFATIYLVACFFECINEFKSFTPIEEEYKREKDLISFFKPPLSPSTLTKSFKDPVKDETQPEIERLYPEPCTLGPAY